MGEQLSMIEEFYADDKRKAEVLKGLEALARHVRWVYGLLYSFEASQGMFSDRGKRANVAIDELEHVTTALAMVVYDELSDIPELKGKKLTEVVDGFCRLELVGLQPAAPTVSTLIDSVYILPQTLFKVSEQIESKRKEILLNALLKFITQVEGL
jgi:hypothetical protein